MPPAPTPRDPRSPPALDAIPDGCPFHPRCDVALPTCSTLLPTARVLQPDGHAACHRVEAETAGEGHALSSSTAHGG